MNVRFLLSGFLVFCSITEVTAQNRLRWRPGAILEGIAGTVQEVARDVGVGEVSVPLPETSQDGVNDDRDLDGPLPPSSDSHRGVIGAQPVQPGSAISSNAGPQSSPAVSVDDVIMMVQRGLGESTIVRFIGANGVKQRLSVSELIRLHEEGVSEPIILAMQTTEVVETAPRPTYPLPVTRTSRARSNHQVVAPGRRSIDLERFGPSILVTQPDR